MNSPSWDIHILLLTNEKDAEYNPLLPFAFGTYNRQRFVLWKHERTEHEISQTQEMRCLLGTLGISRDDLIYKEHECLSDSLESELDKNRLIILNGHKLSILNHRQEWEDVLRLWKHTDLLLADACDLVILDLIACFTNYVSSWLACPGPIPATGMPYKLLFDTLTLQTGSTIQSARDLAQTIYHFFNQESVKSKFKKEVPVAIIDTFRTGLALDAIKQVIKTHAAMAQPGSRPVQKPTDCFQDFIPLARLISELKESGFTKPVIAHLVHLLAMAVTIIQDTATDAGDLCSMWQQITVCSDFGDYISIPSGG